MIAKVMMKLCDVIMSLKFSHMINHITLLDQKLQAQFPSTDKQQKVSKTHTFAVTQHFLDIPYSARCVSTFGKSLQYLGTKVSTKQATFQPHEPIKSIFKINHHNATYEHKSILQTVYVFHVFIDGDGCEGWKHYIFFHKLYEMVSIKNILKT